MKHAVIVALISAAAVSAAVVDGVEYKEYASKTYEGAVLPSYQHYDCDATAQTCYAPKSYGKGYEAGSYTYKRQYAYPGPKDRFKAKLKKIGDAIVGVINVIIGKFHHTWMHFKTSGTSTAPLSSPTWLVSRTGRPARRRSSRTGGATTRT